MAPPSRDIDLAAWLDGIAFHPADSQTKQLGHETARQVVARLGQVLHYLLPPGREKSLAFTHLEEVLMWGNKALAVHGGPNDEVTLGSLKALIEEAGVELAQDPRIDQYEAEQRGEEATGNQLHGEAYGRERTDGELVTGTRRSGVAYTYESTVASGTDGEIKVEINARPGYVEVGTVSTPARIQLILDALQRGEEPFSGLFAGYDNPHGLTALLRELSGAGDAAFGADRTEPEPA